MEIQEAIERVAEYGGAPKTWVVGDAARLRWDMDGLTVTHWSHDD